MKNRFSQQDREYIARMNECVWYSVCAGFIGWFFMILSVFVVFFLVDFLLCFNLWVIGYGFYKVHKILNQYIKDVEAYFNGKRQIS